MKSFWSIAVGLCLLLTLPVHAQESSENCEVGSLNLEKQEDSAPNETTTKQVDLTSSRPAVAATPTTEAEQYVQGVLKQDGLHVVHFWAPWCSNSTGELDNDWGDLVRSNPNVTFTFVTVWNDGEKGAETLDEYNLPDRVTEVTQPDLGPSDNESNRRRSFLTHPVTWIPSTWIFHNNGELAFALNYGEMKMATIQSLLDVTRKDW